MLSLVSGWPQRYVSADERLRKARVAVTGVRAPASSPSACASKVSILSLTRAIVTQNKHQPAIFSEGNPSGVAVEMSGCNSVRGCG